MSVFIAFVKAKGVGSIDAPAISECRVSETLAVGATMSTNTTSDNEIVLVVNGETVPIEVAFGTAPDASLSSQSSVSSAGIPVPAGGSIALNPVKGSKINARTAA